MAAPPQEYCHFDFRLPEDERLQQSFPCTFIDTHGRAMRAELFVFTRFVALHAEGEPQQQQSPRQQQQQQQRDSTQTQSQPQIQRKVHAVFPARALQSVVLQEKNRLLEVHTRSPEDLHLKGVPPPPTLAYSLQFEDARLLASAAAALRALMPKAAEASSPKHAAIKTLPPHAQGSSTDEQHSKPQPQPQLQPKPQQSQMQQQSPPKQKQEASKHEPSVGQGKTAAAPAVAVPATGATAQSGSATPSTLTQPTKEAGSKSAEHAPATQHEKQSPHEKQQPTEREAEKPQEQQEHHKLPEQPKPQAQPEKQEPPLFAADEVAFPAPGADIEWHHSSEPSRLPVSVDEAWHCFFADDAGWPLTAFHESRGDTDVRCSRWSKTAQPGVSERQMAFTAQTHATLGPSTTRALQLQRCTRAAPSGSQEQQEQQAAATPGQLQLLVCTATPDVHCGNCFVTMERFTLVDEPAESSSGTAPSSSSCRVQLDHAVHFSQSSLFAAAITSAATAGTANSHHRWLAAASRWLADHKPDVFERHGKSPSHEQQQQQQHEPTPKEERKDEDASLPSETATAASGNNETSGAAAGSGDTVSSGPDSSYLEQLESRLQPQLPPQQKQQPLSATAASTSSAAGPTVPLPASPGRRLLDSIARTRLARGLLGVARRGAATFGVGGNNSSSKNNDHASSGAGVSDNHHSAADDGTVSGGGIVGGRGSSHRAQAEWGPSLLNQEEEQQPQQRQEKNDDGDDEREGERVDDERDRDKPEIETKANSLMAPATATAPTAAAFATDAPGPIKFASPHVSPPFQWGRYGNTVLLLMLVFGLGLALLTLPVALFPPAAVLVVPALSVVAIVNTLALLVVVAGQRRQILVNGNGGGSG